MRSSPNAQKVIDREAQKWAEWLEMEKDPKEVLNYILAHKIYLLEEQISYLRKIKTCQH